MPVGRFRHEGMHEDYTPGVDVAAGVGVSLDGVVLGVPDNAILANKIGALTTKGVYEFDCDAGIALVHGRLAQFNTTTQKVVTSGGTGTIAVRCAKTPAASDTRIWVKINPAT